MYGDSDQMLTRRTTHRALHMLLLLLLAVVVPTPAAPVTSAVVPTTTTTTTTTTPATDEQLLDSLPEKGRVALMAYELAAALQRLAEQAAAAGDVTEEATARIVTREGDASDYDDSQSQEVPPATTPLHRALGLQPHSTSAAKSISLSEKFQSIVNRWMHATANATYYKVVKVRAKITICFPFNICFEIQDPWGLCCPF